MLDSDSAARLGSRKLGELADMVSQFEILPNYTQINYKGRPRAGHEPLPTETSSSGSPTAPTACLPISSSTW